MLNNYYDIIHGLKSNHLVPLNDHIKLTPSTSEAFKKLAAKAKEDANLDLEVASGYRDFSRQNLIFSEKFLGKRVILDKNEVPLDLTNISDEAKIRAILYFSAIPGLSRHHFGTDIDIYAKNLLPPDGKLELTNIEYSVGPQAPLSAWLKENMKDFGFFLPYSKKSDLISNELWHLSFYEEANCYTDALNLEESLDFLEKQKIIGLDILQKILTTEFKERIKLYPKF